MLLIKCRPTQDSQNNIGSTGTNKQHSLLTHWGRVTYTCVSKLTIIGSDNGLSPGRRQAIIWTNVGILLIGPLGTNFSEILIKIHTFSFKTMYWKLSSAKWRRFGLGLNVLTDDKWARYGTNAMSPSHMWHKTIELLNFIMKSMLMNPGFEYKMFDCYTKYATSI